MYCFRDIYVYVMYYVYVTSGPSLLIESTDSMIMNARIDGIAFETAFTVRAEALSSTPWL